MLCCAALHFVTLRCALPRRAVLDMKDMQGMEDCLHLLQLGERNRCSCCAALCCGLSCCAVLRHAALCHAVLRCAALCHAVLCCTLSCFAVLWFVMLRCAALCYAVLRRALLCCAVLRFVMLCCARHEGGPGHANMLAPAAVERTTISASLLLCYIPVFVLSSSGFAVIGYVLCYALLCGAEHELSSTMLCCTYPCAELCSAVLC